MKTIIPDPIQQTGIEQYGISLRKGETSAEEITKQYLKRIDALNPKLDAYVYVAKDSALETARGIDRLLKGGTDLGPLMGVPVAIKDILTVNGMPTKAGSEMDISDLIPPEGAFVKKLKRLGCIILGKTRTIEFAAGAQNLNHPTPWNPWDSGTRRTPGGSSSGSAVAQAAGLCAFAIGTDTGGSVRLPASLCGVLGLKTTAGRWPTDGVFPLCPAMDTIGLMANSAKDAIIIYSALSDVKIPLTPSLKGLRLGIPEIDFFDNLDPQVMECTQEAVALLKNSGADLVPVAFPEIKEVVDIFSKMAPADLLSTIGVERFTKYQKLSDPVLINRLSPALELSAVEYIRLARRQNELTSIGAERIEGLNGWISPTTPLLPVPVSSCDSIEKAGAFTFKALQNTRPANIYGYCAISLPINRQKHALPVGLQIHCGADQEALLLSLSLAIEQLIGKPLRPDMSEFF